jgi:hypothetical protein
LFHVQNIVGTMIGQHHVHSEQGYVKWRKNIDMNHLLMERVDSCPCGLDAGYVQEFDGRVWLNKEYK